MAAPAGQNTASAASTSLSSPAVHVSDRFTNSHRKTSSPRPTAYETNSVTSQKQLEGTGITSKGDPNPQVHAPPFTMVAGRKQCTHRATITLNKTCSADIYRCIKRRVGRSLGREGRRHEVGPTLCPTMENLDLVYQETSDSKSLTHSRPAERGSRQAIQARPDHPNRVVSPSRGLPINMQQVAPAHNRLICHEVQQQVASVCVTSTRSPGHGSGCTQSTMGGSGRIRLPTSSHLGQSGGEVAGLPMQETNFYCSGVAQHALVLGSRGHVQPNPSEPTQSAQPVNTALQSDPSQKSDKLRLLKEDQPDQSMSQSGPFSQSERH